MTDTMYSLALAVASGELSAEDAAARIGKLVTFTTPEEHDSIEARRERFQAGPDAPDDNSFARVTALYFAGKLSKQQYETLKAGLGLTFPADSKKDD